MYIDRVRFAAELARRNMTLKRLATASGVSRGTLSNIKCGKTCAPLSVGQMQKERLRIQQDEVLSKGERNLILPTPGGQQETLCLSLEFVPLWLAKITITPTMKAERPEVAQKLIKYQLKAKDVLAAAFLPGYRAKDYPPKSTSAGEVASLMKAADRPMVAQRSPAWKRATQAEKIMQQFGVDVIENYVEPLPPEQMTFTITARLEITTPNLLADRIN